VISPDEKVLPARLNMKLIHHLQTIDAVDVFTPRAVYDGRKNLFAARELPIGPQNSQQACSFDVIQYLSFTPM
jgi:eukaryotic translation initiation factor 2C